VGTIYFLTIHSLTIRRIQSQESAGDGQQIYPLNRLVKMAVSTDQQDQYMGGYIKITLLQY